jgi:L-ascorbate metabolism protein UlaG (beta-lactamase superfamily)
LDLILLSHGHGDHLGDTVQVARESGAPVVCLFEVGQYLGMKGLKRVHDMGIGGTQEVAGVRITMTNAVHSGSYTEGEQIVYLGGPAGFILRQHGMPTVYYAGDTALFGDMKIIAELYQPEIAFLPIGDHYTMGPDTAAIAAQWLGVRQVVPMHWGTFPLLTGTPAALKEHLKGTDIEVLDLQPGETAG